MSSDPWADLSNAIFQLCDQFTADRLSHEGFLPDSPAARDALAEPYAAEGWGQAPSRDADMGGFQLAIMAVDHLSCLAGLLRSPRSFVFGPSAVARSAMEVASRGYYLLAPSLDPLERIRRYQNARLASLWDQRILVADLGDAAAASECDVRIGRILRASTRYELSPHPGKNYTPPRIGDGQPSATTLVDEAVSDGDKLGRTSYRVLSAVAHGSRHGLKLFFTEMGALLDRTHGDVFGELEASPEKLALALVGTPMALINMLDRLYARFGWPKADAELAIYSILTTWGRVAGVSIPRGGGGEAASLRTQPPSTFLVNPPEG